MYINLRVFDLFYPFPNPLNIQFKSYKDIK